MTKRKGGRGGRVRTGRPMTEARLGTNQKTPGDDDTSDQQGVAAHALSHELGVDGIAVMTYDAHTGDIRVSFRMGCHIDDEAVERNIAQNMRQACAQLSMSLRERYVDRTVRIPDGEVRVTTMVHADDPRDGAPPEHPPVNSRAPKGDN